MFKGWVIVLINKVNLLLLIWFVSKTGFELMWLYMTFEHHLS